LSRCPPGNCPSMRPSLGCGERTPDAMHFGGDRYNRPMNVAKLPVAMPVDHGRVVDPHRPILTMSYRLGPGRTPAHRHPRAHLFYCAEGVFRLVRKEATWMVPPSQAVWIPSGV